LVDLLPGKRKTKKVLEKGLAKELRIRRLLRKENFH